MAGQYKMLEDIIDSLEIDLKIEKAKGEKYKAMWEAFRFHYGEIPIGEYVDIATQMNNFEGKKIPNPPPVKKTITIEVEADNQDTFEWFIEYIKSKNGQSFSDGTIKVKIKEF